MSTTLTFGAVSVTWPWNYQVVAAPSNVQSQGPWTYQTAQLSNGTNAAQADTLYTAQTTLNSNTNTILNLSALTSALGTSISFARLKAFYFENSAVSNSTNLAIFGAGTTPFSGGFLSAGSTTLSLRNGMHLSVGVCQDATGYAVSTGINLLVNNADLSNKATANIGIVGASV